MLKKGPTLNKRNPQCKQCTARVFKVIFCKDAECKQEIPLGFAVSSTCGYDLSHDHKSPSEHLSTKVCFGEHNGLLAGIKEYLYDCREQLREGADSAGLSMPHLHGLKYDREKDILLVGPKFRKSAKWLELVSELLAGEGPKQLGWFEKSDHWRRLFFLAITDLSAAGYIEKRKLVREADGRRSTLYDQVMAKLEKEGKKWLNIVPHLPDATIIELFKELAENMTSQDELIKDLQLEQLVTRVQQADQGERLQTCEEAVKKLTKNKADQFHVTAIEAKFMKRLEEMGIELKEVRGEVASLREELDEVKEKLASFEAPESSEGSSSAPAALGAPTPAAQVESDELEGDDERRSGPRGAQPGEFFAADAPEAPGAPTPSRTSLANVEADAADAEVSGSPTPNVGSPKSPAASGARTPRAPAPGIFRRAMRRVMQRGRQTPVPTPRTPGAVAPNAAALVTPVRSSPRFRSLAHFLRSPPSTFRFMRS